MAAGTGQLPADVQHGAHNLLNPLGVPVPDRPTPHANVPRSHPTRPGATPSGVPANAGPDLHSMCQTWQAGQKHGHGKDLDPILVTRLGAAAGGTDNIADFCDALLAPTPGPTATPSQPADPKPGHPEKSKTKPSHKPKE